MAVRKFMAAADPPVAAGLLARERALALLAYLDGASEQGHLFRYGSFPVVVGALPQGRNSHPSTAPSGGRIGLFTPPLEGCSVVLPRRVEFAHPALDRPPAGPAAREDRHVARPQRDRAAVRV